jgi:Fe-S cluster biogenesis protein NfuA
MSATLTAEDVAGTLEVVETVLKNEILPLLAQKGARA